MARLPMLGWGCAVFIVLELKPENALTAASDRLARGSGEGDKLSYSAWLDRFSSGVNLG